MWSSILGEVNIWGEAGLHLNVRGADMVARQVFIMIKTKLGGKTVTEARRLSSCHKNEHKNEGKTTRKTESSSRKKESGSSEDSRHKETRGNKVLKCMYANVRSIVRVQK